MPHRVEHRELRIVYWSTLITLLRVAHVSRFPNRRSFGKDLQLIVVYGAVILAFLEGRKPTIASIARYALVKLSADCADAGDPLGSQVIHDGS